MLLNWLDSEVVKLPYVADAGNESDDLAEGETLPITTVLDRSCEGVAVCGVRTDVISVSVGKVALDDQLRLGSSSGIIVSMF